MNAVANDHAIAVNEAARPLGNQNLTAGDSAFNLRFRQAKAFASSELVPAAYRDKVANVMLAIDVAERIGASVFAVMQNLHLIQGRPSWSSTFLIATVNASKRFEPLRFEVDGGDDPTAKTYRVRAYAKDRESGTVCLGAWITWKMVEAEGWASKSGSKWKTMPEQMFLYRAAAFWARVYAPEVSIGLHTVEESVDRFGGADIIDVATNTAEGIGGLKSALLGQPAGATGDMPWTFDEVKDRLEEAATQDTLNEAADLIRELADEEERNQLAAIYQRRLAEVA